jgi:hypothetical protein
MMKPWIDIITENWQLKLLALLSAIILWFYVGMPHVTAHAPEQQKQEIIQ